MERAFVLVVYACLAIAAVLGVIWLARVVG